MFCSDELPARLSYYTSTRSRLTEVIQRASFTDPLCFFTFSLRVKDDQGEAGRLVEGFVHEQQLFGSGEGGREGWQLFERNVGRQSRIQGQHGRDDAMGQQAFRLNTANKWPEKGVIINK